MTSLSEPSPRSHYFSAAIHRHLFVYGGFLEEGDSELHSFSLDREQWWRTATTGQHPPPRLRDGTCISASNYIYLFGGFDGLSRYNNLYKLDYNKWTLLSTIGDTNAPVAKRGCGMVYYEGAIIIVGGYCGLPTGPTQPGAEYNEGFTNEIHQYNLEEGEGT